jgi:bifunctional enzyme CysN/CysC
MPWFNGNSVLSALDSFENKEGLKDKPFRMPVQDIYKFTAQGDDRRIFAGRIESGKISIGDNVIFLPSNKKSQIKNIEEFNNPSKENICEGFSAGLTLKEQVFITRGEIMCKKEEALPYVGSCFEASVFWMGKKPLEIGKEYKLKLCTMKVSVKLKEIKKVFSASDLSDKQKNHIEMNEIAVCILECQSPLAFDIFNEIFPTGRFVIVDEFDIVGGGIITGFLEDEYSNIRKQVFLREQKWEPSEISFRERALRYNQIPKLILLTGPSGVDKKSIAKSLEKNLFESGKKIYFLGIGNLLRGLDADIEKEKRQEHIRRLGEVSNILIDAGLIVIATASDLSNSELRLLQTINSKNEMIIINVGENKIDSSLIDLRLVQEAGIEKNVVKILDLLKFKGIIFSL